MAEEQGRGKAGTRAADNGICIPVTGMDVIVRGLTVTRAPFLERNLLIPLDAHTATILVQPLVDPGTTVNVAFSPEVHEEARIWSIGQAREASKWRIWVRFTCTLHMTR
ncbi:MAG TPA: hypothetical protein VKT33_15565 [Candidatus Angelobacter sp.]|nr:hypothetical protein [Candidatus Angelobacter sp.]